MFSNSGCGNFFFSLRVCSEIALHFRAIPDFLQEHGHARAYVACVRVFFFSSRVIENGVCVQ